MTDFNLKEFLTENKLTALSRLSEKTSSEESSNINENERDNMLHALGLTANIAEHLSNEELRVLFEHTTELDEFDSVGDTSPNLTRYMKLGGPDEIIKELEKEVAQVTLEAKMKKLKEIIELFETKVNSLEEDSELEGFVNSSKLKEMKRTAKKLRSMDEKYMKEYDKKYNKDKK